MNGRRASGQGAVLDLQAMLREADQEIDQLVYALYGLTPEEIAFVEGREANVKRMATLAKPGKEAVTKKKPRKSVMSDDPGLA